MQIRSKKLTYLCLHEPEAMDHMKSVFPENPPKIVYVENPYDAVKEANVLLLVTEWDKFKSLDLNKVKDLMANLIIVEGRNIIESEKVCARGFEYHWLSTTVMFC